MRPPEPIPGAQSVVQPEEKGTFDRESFTAVKHPTLATKAVLCCTYVHLGRPSLRALARTLALRFETLSVSRAVCCVHPGESPARPSWRRWHASLSFHRTSPHSCSNVPGVSFTVTLPLAPAIFMLMSRVQWLQCSLVHVAKASGMQGRSCSLASTRTQPGTRNGHVSMEVADFLPKQMPLMQLVMHTP
jgi:hypothetical protein